MKKNVLWTALVCMAMAWNAARAQEMKEVFVAMPDSLSGVLSEVNRADCVDFLASDMQALVTNRYDRQSELKSLTSDYLFMQTTPQCTWEMKLLPVNDSTKIVCFVRSVYAPVCDSKVTFYTTRWQPLDADKYLNVPQAGQFFLPVDSLRADSVALLREEADITFLKASLSPDEASLSYEYTTPDYMCKEAAEKLKPYLRKSPVRFEWSDGRFVEKSE